MNYVYVIAGAVAGAPLRYFLQSRLPGASAGDFPWGTVIVNVTGCLLIGFVLTLAAETTSVSREARLLLVTGFLGSYTTFSAFGWESFALGRNGELFQASANVLASVALGLVGVWLGYLAARAIA